MWVPGPRVLQGLEELAQTAHIPKRMPRAEEELCGPLPPAKGALQPSTSSGCPAPPPGQLYDLELWISWDA